MNQADIARAIGRTPQHFSTIVCGKADAPKKLAKKIAKITRTNPDIWIFGSARDRKEAVSRMKHQ